MRCFTASIVLNVVMFHMKCFLRNVSVIVVLVILVMMTTLGLILFVTV